MLQLVLQALYFMLPAYIANMAPVFFRKVPVLNYPVDFNKALGGKPILGKNKTFRGFVFGTMFAVLTCFVQYLVNSEYLTPSGVDYSYWLLLGFLLGFGALFGDAVKSFFKRRVGIPPGKPFIPFDQLDYSLGALLFVSMVYLPIWQLSLAAVVSSFFLHIIAVKFAFCSGIRKERW
ncbi:MAG: CDP-archaeol synthase [Candidatus Woesearchaeota archaeon]